jgi:hypothetical protein
VSREREVWLAGDPGSDKYSRDANFWHVPWTENPPHGAWSICIHCWATLLALQEIRSIATKFVATSIFRGNIFQFYHEISGHGSRTHIFPRLFLVAINFHFVAVEDSYCNKVYHGWNTIAR